MSSFALSPRQLALLNAIGHERAASTVSLAREFGVTPQTVRHDLRSLSAAGLLVRYHGGARADLFNPSNAWCQRPGSTDHAATRRIARAIAKAVPEDCSLILNSGLMTSAIAHELVRHKGLRVLTTSLDVAAILIDNPNCEVMLSGGRVGPGECGLMGEEATSFIRQFRVDIGIIALESGEGDDNGFNPDLAKVALIQAIRRQSRNTWLAAEFNRLEHGALEQIGALQGFDVIFTDQSPPTPISSLLRGAGIRTTIVNEIE